MKKIINKWKSWRKIEKVQFIVTLLVGIICLLGCICLLTCKKPKVDNDPLILTASDERIEPAFFGSLSTSTSRIYSYNGSYQNNMGIVACYRVETNFQYYTMPFNLEVAFRDMVDEIDATIGGPFPLCSYWCYSYTISSNSQDLTDQQIQTECTNFLRLLCMNYYSSTYKSGSNELIDVSQDFYNNTKLLSTTDFTLHTYTYFFVGVAFGFNTTTTSMLSIILPYSDSISADNFVFTYTYDEILQVNDFSNNYQEGFQEGLKQGRIEGANSEYSHSSGTIPEMMSFIFNTPVEFIKNAFDIEFMGINVAGIFLGFIAVLLVGWLIKKLI